MVEAAASPNTVQSSDLSITVLLAADSELVRRGIRQLLATQSEIEIVAEAADFAQTIQLANDLKPRLIVMDLHMPEELHGWYCAECCPACKEAAMAPPQQAVESTQQAA